MESIIWLLVYEIQEAQFPDHSPRGCYRPVRAGNGFIVVAPGGQPAFEALARAVGHPEWIDDPRFRSHADRNRNYAELMNLVEEWTCVRSADECEAVFDAGGVPCARYREVQDLFDDPQLMHRQAFREVADKAGPLLVPNPPFTFSDTDIGTARWVAPYGASARDVLGGVLGMDAATVKDLYDRNILYGAFS
jgi:crotonobetainyl-CoA:carnitine CoA-transferase CaiB-like acyl-CoA transferase